MQEATARQHDLRGARAEPDIPFLCSAPQYERVYLVSRFGEISEGYSQPRGPQDAERDKNLQRRSWEFHVLQTGGQHTPAYPMSYRHTCSYPQQFVQRAEAHEHAVTRARRTSARMTQASQIPWLVTTDSRIVIVKSGIACKSMHIHHHILLNTLMMQKQLLL